MWGTLGGVSCIVGCPRWDQLHYGVPQVGTAALWGALGRGQLYYGVP